MVALNINSKTVLETTNSGQPKPHRLIAAGKISNLLFIQPTCLMKVPGEGFLVENMFTLRWRVAGMTLFLEGIPVT